AVPFAAVVSNSCSANKNCAPLNSIAAALVVWQHRAMLFRLVYVSRAVLQTGNDLPAILKWCHEVNPGLGVTGVLGFLDGVYLQYLEGEEAVVEELFARIQADIRHADVTRLEWRTLPRRAFPDWSMHLLEWDANNIAVFRSFSPGANLDLYASDPSTAAPLLRALIRGPDWKL
ncbi:hypothetical protein RCH10_005613, partial [Variovorax sp. GrIS 2.14]|uniref:BLUF domain-containing protein n=1 Tax=Variovorax sp. GrIS 2.14 TaxID=3071709 RepID=UPI0038F80585